MQTNDVVTIYWAPSAFVESDQNWNFLYSDPVPVLSELNAIRNKDVKQMFSCPAYTGSMKNVFVFKNVLPATIKLDEEFFKPKSHHPFPHYGRSKILLNELRPTSLEGYSNIVYNMGWLLFADQSVEARFTAPYFPSSAPAPGVMLSTGQFNIGEWYRDYLLDYHIPFGTEELVFGEEQPLFYLEVRTDKKVVFQRYNLTKELNEIARECSGSPGNYESNKPLSYRYDVFKKTASPQRVLSYIKDNLIK